MEFIVWSKMQMLRMVTEEEWALQGCPLPGLFINSSAL